jgi:putative endonuclease
MFFTYVLKSDKTGRHYYGHSQDVELRLVKHNSGKVRSTKSYRPWKLVHVEEFATKSEAYRREIFFKTIDGYNFLRKEGII